MTAGDFQAQAGWTLAYGYLRDEGTDLALFAAPVAGWMRSAEGAWVPAVASLYDDSARYVQLEEVRSFIDRVEAKRRTEVASQLVEPGGDIQKARQYVALMLTGD